MVKLLKHYGHKVHYNDKQTCCGRLAYEQGYSDETRVLALKFLDDLFGTHPIVCPSSACVAYVKNYLGSLGKQSIKQALIKRVEESTYELSDFLVNELNVESVPSTFTGSAVYLDDSSAKFKSKIFKEPRALLSKVAGLELFELPATIKPYAFDYGFTKHHSEIAAIIDEEIVREIQKQPHIRYIISTETASLMHLQAYIDKQGIDLQTLHIADVLATGL